MMWQFDEETASADGSFQVSCKLLVLVSSSTSANDLLPQLVRSHLYAPNHSGRPSFKRYAELLQGDVPPSTEAKLILVDTGLKGKIDINMNSDTETATCK